MCMIPRGDHTPLRFVITCDNGLFNGGIFMHLSIILPSLCVDKKATLTYFLEPYIYL